MSWDSPSVESDEAETELGSSFSSRWNEAVVKKKTRSRNTTSISGVILKLSDARCADWLMIRIDDHDSRFKTGTGTLAAAESAGMFFSDGSQPRF